MNVGDKVGLIHAGKTYEGSIVDIITHDLGPATHTSLKIKIKKFSLPVIINITLFPYRVWSLDS
jgi:hypothetical protein